MSGGQWRGQSSRAESSFLRTKKSHVSGRNHALHSGKPHSRIEGRIQEKSCLLRVCQRDPPTECMRFSPCLQCLWSSGNLQGIHIAYGLWMMVAPVADHNPLSTCHTQTLTESSGNQLCDSGTSMNISIPEDETRIPRGCLSSQGHAGRVTVILNYNTQGQR